MRKAVTLLTCFCFVLFLSGCASTSSGRMSPTNLQQVNLGDTFEQVINKLGEPSQVLSKEITEDNNEKVVWLYAEKINIGRQLLKGGLEGAAWGMNPEMMKSKQQAQSGPPTYAVTFINGQVSDLKRVQ
jgi:hypothetical protein